MPENIHVSYADIQSYLEAIANNPANQRQVDDSAHGRFWNVSYAQFTTGNVPDERCHGAAIPIVNADPAKCAFYQSLKAPTGFCNLAQMPKRGPFITSPGYQVTLANGVVMTGGQIDDNIVWWLTNGMPEH